MKQKQKKNRCEYCYRVLDDFEIDSEHGLCSDCYRKIVIKDNIIGYRKDE